MKTHIARENIKIPENVNVSVILSTVLVKGLLGKLERNFSHVPIDIRQDGNEIFVEVIWPNKKRMAMVRTIQSHIKNMITGVTKGFTYKLKIVYAHFPMSVKIEDHEVIVENFSGERKSRKFTIPDGVKVTVEGDDILVKGIDIEKVSQTAASIQQGVQIKKKDPRIFLDGIYIYKEEEGI